jgi:hypothetical protein
MYVPGPSPCVRIYVCAFLEVRLIINMNTVELCPRINFCFSND